MTHTYKQDWSWSKYVSRADCRVQSFEEFVARCKLTGMGVSIPAYSSGGLGFNPEI